MSKILSKLNPNRLWQIFEEMCEIPHPSKYEDAMRDYVINFAKKNNLEFEVDETGNVVIRKPATKGMENRKGVILQGHLDMVPQANSDIEHDFTKDPIKPRIDGEWVKATGTTLGADNGIGVSTALAILESKDISHGPLEALFTIDEETGMTGAFGLKPGFLKGDIMMNLDSEDEGELFIGCAGGTNGSFTFTYKEVGVPKNVKAFKLNITGLKGGHSGCDIHLYRGNANKILFRYLKHAETKHGLRLASVDGGTLRNAIPREAFAVFVVPANNAGDIPKCVAEMYEIIRKEYATVEPDFKITVEETSLPENLIDEVTQKNFINAIVACPNDVIRMSNDMPGLVETSTNLAIVKSENGKIEVRCLLRSSVDSAKEYLEQTFACLFELAGAEIVFDGKYPGWKPNPHSPILEVMIEGYEKQFGNKPKISAIHAGLECGLIGGVYPNLDMISFGPTIRNPHSPDEMVNIETVNKFWDYILQTLANVPTK
ncbi:MAG: aminoacyl-histidine dipeptidase [Ignavibacteria bacterium]|nr:aminoacyl-histidine dipeptidase [Ignavibacteria bacterium]